MKMVKLTSLSAQDTVAKLMLQYTSLIPFKTKLAAQAHSFDFLSKNFWKREQFSVVLKENNGDPSVIEWRILHICKTDVAQTLGPCRS